MKIVSILVSLMAVSTLAHAATDEFKQFDLAGATPAIDEMTLVASNTEEATAGMQTMQAPEQQPMFGKETSTWNFNLGMSEFDYNSDLPTGAKGKGLSFEVQKRFWDMFYAGFNYTNYTTESVATDMYNNTVTKTKTSMDMTTVSLEAHMIRLPLPGRSEFFGAVNAGLMAPLNKNNGENIVGSNYFFGAGVGINISNQIGLRADIKSTPEVRAYNSFSLVGYY